MMGKVLIIENTDGTVGVEHPTPQMIAKLGSDEAVLNASIAKGNLSAAVSYEMVEASVIPANRKFRNAWEKSGDTIVEDMPKSRVIHMDKIRVHRTREFLVLDQVLRDAEYDEDTVALAAAKTKRQDFKNIPQTSQEADDIAAATTTAALDAIWPTALLGARPADIV